MKPFDLFLPATENLISQPFGANDNGSYHADGLKGHSGTDFAIPYGDPIYACTDAEVYSIQNKGSFDPDKYQCVYQLIETSQYAYELSYGHLGAIAVNVGDSLTAGRVLGYCGNTGRVYSGGVAVTVQERLNGSHAGAHVHFQLRKCRRVVQTNPLRTYLHNGYGILYKNGYYYEVIDWSNGYNGCIDASLIWNGIQAKDAKQTIDLYVRLIATLTQLLAKLKGISINT